MINSIRLLSMTTAISISHLPGSDKECRDVMHAYVSLWLDWLTPSLRLSSPVGRECIGPRTKYQAKRTNQQLYTS